MWVFRLSGCKLSGNISHGLLRGLAVLVAVALSAQIVGAIVSGAVTDPTGLSVPKAQLRVKNTSTQVERTAITDDRGFYVVPNLTPGDYEIAASAAGMERQVTELNLAVGSEQELNFHLHLGRVKQKVEVGETAAGGELSRSASGDVVRGTE